MNLSGQHALQEPSTGPARGRCGCTGTPRLGRQPTAVPTTMDMAWGWPQRAGAPPDKPARSQSHRRWEGDREGVKGPGPNPGRRPGLSSSTSVIPICSPHLPTVALGFPGLSFTPSDHPCHPMPQVRGPLFLPPDPPGPWSGLREATDWELPPPAKPQVPRQQPCHVCPVYRTEQGLAGVGRGEAQATESPCGVDEPFPSLCSDLWAVRSPLGGPAELTQRHGVQQALAAVSSLPSCLPFGGCGFGMVSRPRADVCLAHP